MLGEHVPVVDERLFGLLVLPKDQRLALGVVDAVARRAVEIQAQMDRVFPAQIDGAVDLLQRALVDLQHVVGPKLPGLAPVGIDPKPVVHGQADEVEAPVADPLAVVLRDGAAALFAAAERLEEVQQIEAAPAGNGCLRRLRRVRFRGAEHAGQRRGAGSNAQGVEERTTMD